MEEENSVKQAELEELQQQVSPRGSTGGRGSAFIPKQHGIAGTDETKDVLSNVSDSVDDDLTISEEIPIETGANAEIDGEPLDNFVATGEDTDEISSSEIESPSDSSSKEDFTLSHLAIESLRAFITHAKDDVKRIIALVVPVMQPILTASDLAWRQIKALFFMARDAYYESSSEKQPPTEQTESEERADGIAE